MVTLGNTKERRVTGVSRSHPPLFGGQTYLPPLLGAPPTPEGSRLTKVKYALTQCGFQNKCTAHAQISTRERNCADSDCGSRTQVRSSSLGWPVLRMREIKEK